MNSQDEKLERVKNLLAYDGHSRRYQAVPDFVARQIDHVGAGYASDQLAWDEPRYDWIKENLPGNISSLVELGSSLGYFSLRLSYELNVTAKGYEPVEAYAELCNLFASLTGMESRAQFHCKSIGLADIGKLPDADVLIFLNVLHHAGNIFDAEAVADCDEWVNYATEYLRCLNKKYTHLIFQTGNSAAGAAHFPSKLAAPTLVAILNSSGWKVERIGIITDFSDPAYQSFDPGKMDLVPRIGCHRNPQSGLVEYRTEGKLLAKLKYGTLQRPLFYCRSD